MTAIALARRPVAKPVVALFLTLGLISSPLRAEQPTEQDIRCLLAIAKAGSMAEAELKDPATEPERRAELEPWSKALRGSSSWFIGRITMMPPAERSDEVLERNQQNIEALDEEALYNVAGDCLDQVQDGRDETLNRLY